MELKAKIKVADFDASEIDDSVIVENKQTGDVHEMNFVAATILNGLKEREGSPVSVSDLLGDIKEKFDVGGISDDALIADINQTLDSFVESGLIVVPLARSVQQ